jgi:hypothetical protein
MSNPTTLDDLPRPNLSPSSFNSAFNANPEPRTRKPAIYSIKSQLSSHSGAQRYETANLNGEFHTFSNSDDELPRAERIKSKV